MSTAQCRYRGGHQGKCGEIGEELLKCISVKERKICRVRIRKINVDLEIEDQDRESCD